MNLATLEGRAIHRLYNRFNPDVTLDLHEFGGAGAPPPETGLPVTTWNTLQVAGPQGSDNDPQLFAANNELVRTVALRASEKYGYGSTNYYTGSTTAGADPSVHRHHFAHRNSLSLLFETGGGAGVVNLPMRVDTQITATFAAFDWVLADEARVHTLVKNADAGASTPQPGIQGWLVPPQENLEKAADFLSMHGFNVTRLDKDAAYLAQNYAAGPASLPSMRSFPNGTLLVNRFQPDGRLAYELFENQDDPYYVKGPRSWPLDAYRILSA